MAARRYAYGHSDRPWCIPVRSSAFKRRSSAAPASSRTSPHFPTQVARAPSAHPLAALSIISLPPACAIGRSCHAGRAGTLGAPARRFIDHLAATGLRYWQVLPVNPTDSFGSPYAGPSAVAGNPKLLEETSTELKRAIERFKAEGGFTSREFFEFARENESGLDPYCAVMAVKDTVNGTSRHSWPDELRRYHVDIFADARFADRARYHAFVQFRFEREWTEMLAYAHDMVIEIVGDIPM